MIDILVYFMTSWEKGGVVCSKYFINFGISMEFNYLVGGKKNYPGK